MFETNTRLWCLVMHVATAWILAIARIHSCSNIWRKQYFSWQLLNGGDVTVIKQMLVQLTNVSSSIRWEFSIRLSNSWRSQVKWPQGCWSLHMQNPSKCSVSWWIICTLLCRVWWWQPLLEKLESTKPKVLHSHPQETAVSDGSNQYSWIARPYINWESHKLIKRAQFLWLDLMCKIKI